MYYKLFRFALALALFSVSSCSKSHDEEEVDLSSSSETQAGSSSSNTQSSSSNTPPHSSSSTLVVDPATLSWVGNPPILITEISLINMNWPDHTGDKPAWIELYNPNSAPVNLNGLAMVEKLDMPRKWVFGNVVVPGKGFTTVFISKLDIPTPPTGNSTNGKNRAHTNYKLEKDGGTLYLVDSLLGIRDSISYPALPAGVSWGVGNGGKWAYYDLQTPEAPNTGVAYSSIAPAVSFSGGGFYAEPTQVEYPTVPNADVRCTDDGSLPTASTPISTGSVYITQNTVLRCAAFQNGAVQGPVSTQSFFIGESSELPVVSISVDPTQMFDKEVGLYMFGPGGNYKASACNEPCLEANFFKDEELRVHVEFFESNGTKAFGIEAGLNLMGQWSRYNPKKSVKINMRNEYQDGRLNYTLFPDFPQLNKFKAFVLRNNGNRFMFDYITDAMASSLLKGSGLDYMKSRQTIVFYNGQYWGIHDLRERLNEHYVESNYGIESSNVDAVKHVGSSEIDAHGGTTDAYIEMLDYVANANFSDPSTQDLTWAAIKQRLDVGNFADYMAAGIYFQNTDWPNNNVRAWRTRSPASPFKFMVFDLDHGFGWEWSKASGTSDYNMFNYIASGEQTSKPRYLASFFVKLLKHPQFKALFINRSAVMISHYFAPDKVEAAIEYHYSTIPTKEKTRDLERFPYGGNGWGGEREYYMAGEKSKLLDFAADRPENLRDHYRSKFDLGADAPLQLVATGSGSIQVHGMVLPSKNITVPFFAGHPVELTAVPESGATFLQWSDGVTEATRWVDPAEVSTLTAQFR